MDNTMDMCNGSERQEKAYGSKEPLIQKCIDHRFDLVTRGSAPNIEDLGGRWAWPGPGYDKN